MAKTPLLVPYAALENLQMQIAGFSRREARPDAVGTLRLDDGHSLDVAFGAGEFPTLSSIRFPSGGNRLWRSCAPFLLSARRLPPVRRRIWRRTSAACMAMELIFFLLRGRKPLIAS